MKNILITGGAGFIGSNLTIKLIENGYNVTVLDNLSEQIHGRDSENTSPLFLNIKNKVNFLKGSIVDRKLLSDALRNQDVVIHLAAETGTGQSMYNIENYTQVNVGGTALLLDILANGKNKYAVKKLIVASSRSVYGEGRYFSEEFGMV